MVHFSVFVSKADDHKHVRGTRQDMKRSQPQIPPKETSDLRGPPTAGGRLKTHWEIQITVYLFFKVLFCMNSADLKHFQSESRKKKQNLRGFGFHREATKALKIQFNTVKKCEL